MGGGGGGSLGDLRTLEDRVKREFERASETGVRNVFISFAYEDLNDVNLLRGQAKNENAVFGFHDWSVKVPFDSKRAEYIRQRIRERIRQSSITLVYVSDQTASSRWVDWEVRESSRQGKAVVAVYKGDSPPKLPKILQELGVNPVKWTHDSIATAIERVSQQRVKQKP